jgi:hypothetical protein
MAGLVWLLTGCSGYRLGPMGGQRAGVTSIEVSPLVNRTPEPRLSDAITSSLRKRLQQDGTYRLNTSKQGDIIVSGSILEYDRKAVSFKPTDTRTPLDYLVVVTAQVVARERATGRVLLDRKVDGHTTVRAIADQTNAERQMLPLVADELARKITQLLVEGEW